MRICLLRNSTQKGKLRGPHCIAIYLNFGVLNFIVVHYQDHILLSISIRGTAASSSGETPSRTLAFLIGGGGVHPMLYLRIQSFAGIRERRSRTEEHTSAFRYNALNLSATIV